MATSKVKVPYLSGYALTAKLFDIDGVDDTVRATASSVTEQTNDLGTYVCTFTNVSGSYKVKLLFASDGDVAAEEFCNFPGVDLEVVSSHSDSVLLSLESYFPLVSSGDITTAILALATAINNNRTYGV